MMNAKDYLERPMKLKKQIEWEEMQIENLTERIEHGSHEIKQIPAIKYGYESRLEELIADKADKQAALEQMRTELEETQDEIAAVIHGIEDETTGKMMEARYIGGKSFREIGSMLHYSRGHLHRIHQKGLEAVTRILRSGKDET